MRIIYCGCFRLPNFDAASSRVLNNAKAFHSLGHDVKLLSWGGQYRETDLCEDGKYRLNGMEYIITGELDFQGSFLYRFLQMYKRGSKTMALLNEMSEKPDLIVMYNADYCWTKQVLNYCKKYNVKIANDITEWYDNNELHFWDILPNHFNMASLQLRVNNKICISTYLDRYYKESNNLLLPPLCDPDDGKWKASIDDNRVKAFDGVTLIYAGNPAKKDCLHSVINAVNTLANKGKAIRFLILGITRESYIRRYGKYLLDGSLNDNVIFLGRVSQDLIPAYYKKADFMVLLRKPNRKNMAGFPTKFAESMTSGVPVITNATSDLANYVVDGKTGFLVDGYDYESILYTLTNSVVAIKKDDINMMKSQVSRIKLSFDWHHYLNNINNFLNNLY